MVETNGVSISILLVRKEYVGKKVRKPRVGPPPPEQYIDELTDYTKVADKKLVAIDPNMSDLLYCVDGPDADKTIYRYTQDTRRKDTYVKKHRDYLQTRKHKVIDGKRVVEWEVELSAYNKKTTNFAAFKTCKTCQRLWNRDTNASSNIWRVANSAINGLPRPEHLRRIVQANYTVGSDASSPRRRTRHGPSPLHRHGKV
ncbi:unnamed protein product [Sphagnum tenellum]